MTSLAPVAPPLRAVTRPLDAAPLDLLAARGGDGFAWLHDGAGLVTLGVAARVDAGDADDLLATIEVDDPLGWPGTGPIACGALPFDPDEPATLVVPRRVVGLSRDGRAWVTEIGDDAPRLRIPDDAAPEPTRWTVERAVGADRWRAQARHALDEIAAGHLEKVVLARAVTVTADVPVAPGPLLARLRDRQPGCFVHHADGLVGATPELLVRRDGTTLESRPLAGTAPAGTDAAARLAASGKDAREHRVVVAGIVDELTPWCDTLDADAAPSPVAYPSVVHLATSLRGQLRSPAPSALALARRLHPTAAVAGAPRPAALATIAALEGTSRGRYAGPVGWVDARGDGEWAVALRGAELDGLRAVLRAGAGIVAGSDPDAEWAETQAKLEPMLGALVRP